MLLDGKEVLVSRGLRADAGFWAAGIGAAGIWVAGMAALLPTAPAGAQGNIDAGRSPAQIFADTCASCHRSARELRRPSASFLRQHYTAGAEEASAMASYLSGLPAEPKGAQPKRPPAAVGDQPAEAKQQPKQQPKGKQQAKQQPATETPAEQPAATQHTVTQPAATQPAAPQAQAKGRRGATAEVRPAAPAPAAAEERPAAPTPAPPTPPAPALEPFEE
jgi:hypothetical protein